MHMFSCDSKHVGEAARQRRTQFSASAGISEARQIDRRGKVFTRRNQLITTLLAATALSGLTLSAHAKPQLYEQPIALGDYTQETADFFSLFLGGEVQNVVNPNGTLSPQTRVYYTTRTEIDSNGSPHQVTEVHFLVSGQDPDYGTVQPLPGGSDTFGGALTLDKNGNPVVVGSSESSTAPYPFHAIMWTLAGGTVDLGVLPIGPANLTQSSAFAISRDASVIVGDSSYDPVDANGTMDGTPVGYAFRYTVADKTMRSLGTIGNAPGISTASGVNQDGSVVVGRSDFPGSRDNPNDAVQHAFRWVQTPGSQDGVMTDIDGRPAYDSNGLGTPSEANAVTPDGNVVVGDMQGESGIQAFRWTQATGMVPLGTLTSGGRSTAEAVSDDGQIVVGYAGNRSGYIGGGFGVEDPNTTAFRWTQATGIQDLNVLASNAGINMTGVHLADALSISGDGQFIGGNGTFPDTNGQLNGYILRYCDATNMAACTSSGGTGTGTGGTGTGGTGTGTGGGGTTPIAGATTAASVQASIDQVAAARRMILIQEFGEAAQLLGANERIGSGSEIGVFAAGGTDDSLDGGAAGRVAFGNGLSILTGLADGEEHYGRVKTDATFMGALAVRYIYDTGGAWRPYGEAGAWGVPGATFTFTRTYANGAGTSAGTSTVNAAKYYAYGRVGGAFTPDVADEIALSGEVGHGALHTGGFAESFSAVNPFEASGTSATDETTVGKLRLQWTHAFTAKIDATLWGAAASAFDYRTTFAAGVPGFGLVTPTHIGRPGWAEYGGRVGYKITAATTFDIYADGVSGDQTIGTDIRIGAAARYTF